MFEHLKRILIIAAAALCACMAYAQPRPNTGSSDYSGRSDEEETPKVKTVYKPGSAWQLFGPLGFRKQSTIDTLLYNYQRFSIPSMVSDAYATTGNLGAEGQNQIYFQRPELSTFFFESALSPYLPSYEKQKFYNVYVPMTLLSYNTGGGKQVTQDRLKATFAGNVNRRVGIGANLDYIYSKGSYNYQALKNFMFGFSGYYTGDRYEMAAFYNHYNSLNKENGGITDDLYITDPAELQGGVSKIDSKSIPTRLSNAHSRLLGDQLYMSHAYKIGYWKEEQVNDTLTRDVYVPMLKFIYNFDMRYGHHIFLNDNPSQAREFWENAYISRQRTADGTFYRSIANTLGISMVEGFRKWAKFGLAAYIKQEYRSFKQTPYELDPELTEEQIADLTPLPEGFGYKRRASQNLVWLGGQITKQKGEALTIAADASFGLIGDVVGDVDINASIGSRFHLLKDTVEVRATGFFRNTEQPYLLQHYMSNHFAWDNDFGKTRRFRIGGELYIPWSKTLISAGVENVQNLVYFNGKSLPAQCSGSIQVFSARLEQKLKFGIWNWNNSITYQTTSRDDVLALPQLSVYSNMFLDFKAFRVLHLQIGFDCDYYTKYRAPLYQPATMSFRTQWEGTVGNYPFCNAYLTAKLYKVRFYVLWSHVNQGWFSKDYFSMLHYPLNPRRFQMGLSIDFAN